MNTISRCTRAASFGAAAFALVAALPAQAQFGFSFGGGKKKDVQTVEGCPQGQKKSIGGSRPRSSTPRSWRAWAFWPAALPTISTTC